MRNRRREGGNRKRGLQEDLGREEGGLVTGLTSYLLHLGAEALEVAPPAALGPFAFASLEHMEPRQEGAAVIPVREPRGPVLGFHGGLL